MLLVLDLPQVERGVHLEAILGTSEGHGGGDMPDSRKRYTAKVKEVAMVDTKCYVCEDLGLDHAGFDGYEPKDAHFDHYQIPFSSLGGSETDTLLIHAAAGGTIADDEDFETSKRRNCHRMRGNEHSSRAGFVQVVKARLEVRTVSYIDDVSGNVQRDASSRQYLLPVKWSETDAEFIGKNYPLVVEERLGHTWRRFMATVRADQVFTDDTSQVRPASRKSLLKMVLTFLEHGFPMFAPVNARVDKCGHIVIFDGNHRATADALAFGVTNMMPIMIWDIESDDSCALRSDVLIRGTRQTTKPKGGSK